MKRTLAGLLALTLLVGVAPQIATAAVKAGATCTKLKSTTTVSGYKYTCIKSGKKLVWSKGVKVVATPKPSATPTLTPAPSVSATPSPSASATPTPSASPTPAPTPSASPTPAPTPSASETPTPTPSASATPSPSASASPASTQTASANIETVSPLIGTVCKNSGDIEKLSSLTYVECRYVYSGKLKWVQLFYTQTFEANPASPTDIANCKIKEMPNLNLNYGDGDGPMGSGFGFKTFSQKMMKTGTMKIAILPVDFAEIPGESNIKETLDRDIKLFKEWFNYYSQNKLKIEVVTTDKWVRATLPIKSYDVATGYPGMQFDDAGAKVQQAYLDLAPDAFDFKEISEMFIVLPKAQRVINSDLRVGFRDLNTKQGKQFLNVSAPPAILNSHDQPNWTWWIHEGLHDIGLAGHAPAQGNPLDVMGDQNSNGYSISAWDQFILEWLNDDQVYCVDKPSIKGQIVKLSQLEREDTATKAIVVPLTEYSALVVQAHGQGKWTSKTDINTKMLPGFYGITVYKVDTRWGNDRRFEVFFGNDVSNGLGNYNANAKALDNGNDPAFPKFAYLIPVEGGQSNPWNWFSAYNGINETFGKYVGLEGDSFVADGVRFKFLKSGDFNSVQISIDDSSAGAIDPNRANLKDKSCEIVGTEIVGIKLRNEAGYFECTKTSDGKKVWKAFTPN